MQTYLFYDIETTGLNKAFDQVLQFAAIRTDLNLNEIERHEIKIKLNNDVIPSPEALITHHIGFNDIASSPNEYEAIKQIHRWLNHPGTISLGYNTLGFDDEFLRFSFYRNLLPPYTHQYANQCSRMDLYPMTVMYFLFKKSILNWPMIEGKYSLKLEQLSKHNQLAEGQAHDAMVDVEATLALAKRFIQEKEMWQYLSGYFNKKTDEERMRQDSVALVVDGAFGSASHYQAIGLFIGAHRHYKNQYLWLRLDTDKLIDTTLTTISEKTQIIRKKLGEPSFILPIKDRFKQQLPSERIQLAESNKQWLSEHPELYADICDYHANYTYPAYPDADIDSKLYINGFWSAQEEAFCRTFHAATPDKKATLLTQIQNPNLYTMALRILGRHYPEVLNDQQTKDYAAYLNKISPSETESALIDFQGRSRLTPTRALQTITQLLETSLSPKQRDLLNELTQYLTQTFGTNNPSS